jgi:hypothetical protein
VNNRTLSEILAERRNQDDVVENDKIFSVRIEVPNHIELTKPIKVRGILINNSNKKIDISFGANLFNYQVLNQEGKAIASGDSTVVIASIGILKTMNPKEEYSFDGSKYMSKNLNEILINEPGEYKLIAVANLEINENKQSNKMEIKSEPVKVNVSNN